MINRKPTLCYVCRQTIQRGQAKYKFHGTNYAHTECKRVKKSKSRLTKIWDYLTGG